MELPRRMKLKDAAPLWGMTHESLVRRCNKGQVPEAVKLGKIWYVTPGGMDRLFLPKRNK